jgi:hypothetical protein
MRISLIVCLLSGNFFSWSQVQCKAISYKIVIDLEVYDPAYAAQTDAEELEAELETDVYFTDTQVRTITRVVSIPPDYQLTLPEFLYTSNSDVLYAIFPSRKVAVKINRNTDLKPRKSRGEKNIIGFACKRYFLNDLNDYQAIIWMTDKIRPDVSPLPNYKVKGAILELITDDGFHITAMELKEGEVESALFTVPSQMEILSEHENR